MGRIRWSVVLLGLALAAVPARAQGVVYYNPYGYNPYGSGYDYGVSGVSFNYARGRHHSAVSIAVNTIAFQGFAPVCAPPLFGPFFGPVNPPLVNPYWVPPPVTVINYRLPPAVPGPFIVDDLALAILPRREAEIPLNPRPLPERPKPAENVGNPRPADPKAGKPLQPDPPAKPEPPKPAQPKPVEPARIPHPDPEPRGENARLIALGKKAFGDTEYGLAAQRFRQAATVLPTDAQANFLLAQALFALGKYQDAVDAINEGMVLEPTWPAANFHPLDLYGDHVANYPDHLQRLEDVVAHHPNDGIVLFLSGYELWFDGRKDEARVLFQKALAAGADPLAIDRFVRALPPGGGV